MDYELDESYDSYELDEVIETKDELNNKPEFDNNDSQYNETTKLDSLNLNELMKQINPQMLEQFKNQYMNSGITSSKPNDIRERLRKKLRDREIKKIETECKQTLSKSQKKRLRRKQNKNNKLNQI